MTEDFFLEMLGTISSLKSDDVGEKIYKKYGEEKIYYILIQKLKDGNIPDITDFRYLTKIIKQHRIPSDKRERVIMKVLSVNPITE